MDTDKSLIFINYLDEGWLISAPGVESEGGEGTVNPPVPSFKEALESATDMADMLSGATIVLSKGAAKVALREMRRRRKLNP